MKKGKVKSVDLSEAEVTPRGTIFLQWLEATKGDGKDQSIEEIIEEFNQYYESIFNPTV